MNTVNLLQNIISGRHISSEDAQGLVNEVVQGSVSSSQLGALLAALRMKGETSEEIAGFVRAMREHMLTVDIDGAIDVCGTGGDGSGTFNISTAVALVVAGCGVKVAKHGNRAASSQTGSADVVEALGVMIQLTPEQARIVCQKVGIVFLFAPLFHPAFKEIGRIRKELGIRTVFNVLGPFANPASTKRQLIGTGSIALCETLAHAGKLLGYEHLVVVSSEDGMDEVSIAAPTRLFEVKGGKIEKMTIQPEQFGLRRAGKDAVLGGDSKVNAAMIREVLAGVKGPRRDIVLLNSAVALYVAGKAKSIAQGVQLAAKSIDKGLAKQALTKLIRETQKYATN